jgi:hypothetical protein
MGVCLTKTSNVGMMILSFCWKTDLNRTKPLTQASHTHTHTPTHTHTHTHTHRQDTQKTGTKNERRHNNDETMESRVLTNMIRTYLSLPTFTNILFVNLRTKNMIC